MLFKSLYKAGKKWLCVGSLRVCARGRSPKVILSHMPKWQQTVKTMTRTGDSVKQFGTQRVSFAKP